MNGTASVFSDDAVPPSDLWRSTERFCVLDTCFGNGSSFATLRKTWKNSPGNCRKLHYIGLCGDQDAPPPHDFQQSWPLPLPGHHHIPLSNDPEIQLTLVFGKTRKALQTLAATFDLLLLLGEEHHAADLARVSRRGTTFYTRSKSEVFWDALQRAGFTIEENSTLFTRGSFRGAHQRTHCAKPYSGSKRAIVIGAGLAGTAAAASLASRNWSVTVFEKQQAPAMGASGNLAAAISPMLSKDDGIAARLSRACFLALLAELRRLDASPHPAKWAACGLLQLAKDDKEAALFRDIIESSVYPPQFVRFLNKDEASAQAGCQVPGAGFYFPQGGWVNPPSLCHARLHSPQIRLCHNIDISDIGFEKGVWRVQDKHSGYLEEAPVLILANAFEAARFSQCEKMHFKKVRGQVTHLAPTALPPYHGVISRNGYLTPALEGLCSLGATYDFDSDEKELDAECQQVNLARISSLLDGVAIGPRELAGRVGFRSLTADRLPVIGAIPDYTALSTGTPNVKTIARRQGLYGLLGLGSRGVVWSTLAGETLAALIEGEPSPLPSDLLGAMDPARFLEREYRKSNSTRMS